MVATATATRTRPNLADPAPMQPPAEQKKEKPTTFPAMLQAFLPEIERALPEHLSGDRMARIALTAFRRTPKLARCAPLSVFAAVIQAAQLGLEPDTLGRAYLIPYKNNKVKPGSEFDHECQFVPGWKGLVDLMNRSGQGTVYTGVIFRDQKYRFRDGSTRELDVLNETVLHAAEDITHAYAVGWIKGAEMPVIELWRVEKIRMHRDRYNKVGKDHYSYTNWEMYARKVPLLQVLKYMPSSAELAHAMALSDAAEIGRQGLNLQDAIEGTWAPVDDDDGGDSAGGPTEPESPAAGDQSTATPQATLSATTSQGAPAEQQVTTGVGLPSASERVAAAAARHAPKSEGASPNLFAD